MDSRGIFVGADLFAQATCTDGSRDGSIAVLPNGEFLVARTAVNSGAQSVYAVIFDGMDNRITPDIVLNQASGTVFSSVQAIAHPAGYFLVVWDAGAPVGDVFGRLVNPDGSLPGGETRLPEGPPGSQGPGRVAAFDSGEIVACWIDTATSPFATVKQRRFDPALIPLGSESAASQNLYLGSGFLDIAARGMEYIVAWDGSIAGEYDVRARRFNQTSGPLGNEFIVNTFTNDVQVRPACAIDAQGRALILWMSNGQSGASTELYGQRLDPMGSKWGPEFRDNMTLFNSQGDASAAMLPSGDFLTTFASNSGTNLEGLMMARRFFFPLSLAVAPGPAASNGAQVDMLRPDGRPGSSAAPYGGAYGAYVGTGNIDGSALDEVLTGPGPSPVYGPHVRAFRPDATPLQKLSFYAYGTLRYGVKPNGANLDGDAAAELLSTPGQGAVFGPHVRGWNYDGATLTAISKISFFAYGTLKYGANSSHGNVDGDAFDEILAGPGPGIMFAPQLRAFNYDASTVTAIAKINANAFPTTSYGATISAADIESDGVGGYGDGYDELLAGQGPGPSFDSELRIFDYDNASLAQKFAVTPYTTLYGLHAAGGDVDAGDTEEVVTAPGPDPAATAHILCWEWNPALGTNTVADLQTIGTDDFVAFPGELYGANVAVGTFE